MQIILLTHEREFARPTNTGRLAIAAFPDSVICVPWSRTAPDQALVAALISQDAQLLFPADSEDRAMPDIAIKPVLTQPKQIVILDATWQEARKMLRQSPYLQSAAKIELPYRESGSAFVLRRNQQEGGLCTAECIIALWQQAGYEDKATVLASLFTELNRRN